MGEFTIHFSGVVCHVLDRETQRALLPDGRNDPDPHDAWLYIRQSDLSTMPPGFQQDGDCWRLALDGMEIGFDDIAPAKLNRLKKFDKAAPKISRIGRYVLDPLCRTSSPTPAVAYVELQGDDLDACYTEQSAKCGSEPEHRYAKRVYLFGETKDAPVLFIRKYSETIAQAMRVHFDQPDVVIGIVNTERNAGPDPSHFTLMYKLFEPKTGPVPQTTGSFSPDDCRLPVSDGISISENLRTAGPGCSNSQYP
jgi:hypothetical protein